MRISDWSSDVCSSDLFVSQLDGVGVAEQPGTEGEPAWAPVAEDHRSETDEAAARGLALPVDAGEHEDEHRSAEAGQRTGDGDGDRLEPVNVHAQRLGRDRVLAPGAEAKPARRPPHPPPGRRDNPQ